MAAGTEHFRSAVAAAREHIWAGDIFQANICTRFDARLDGDPLDVFCAGVDALAPDHAAYLDTGRYRVLSASPELFFRIDGERIRTRPMKGTAPRGRWPAEDEEAAARLLDSAKDRAENAMIVDLLRNDLGRICRPGSIEVERMFETERYETVWQLTSTIEGDLRSGVTLVDAFRALFPSGSVTGAPKAETMRIIREVEARRRGIYCGAIGWVAPPNEDVRARFNVAIRTAHVDLSRGACEYGVGSGITWSSQATAEFAELLAKRQILVNTRWARERQLAGRR